MYSSFSDSTVEAELRRLKNEIAASTVAHTFVQTPIPIPFDKLPLNLRISIRSAGLRPGETRSWLDAHRMYEKIPEGVRRQGIKAIEKYKSEHDWSHHQAYSRGGSNQPHNGSWESRSVNRARGGRNMTAKEKQAVEKTKNKINFESNVKTVVTGAVKAGTLAFAVEGAFSGLENFIAVQRGEKTVEDAVADTIAQSTYAAVSTATITSGVITLSIIFPPLGVALGAATPILKIVGIASCATRLISIIGSSPKVQGADQIYELYELMEHDPLEEKFRELEINAQLDELKQKMGIP